MNCINFVILFCVSWQAIDGTYIDKKCPFTGNVSIRGRILTGVVQKMKMQRTIVIRRDYLHYIRKYNRFEKRHRNMSVHLSPCFRYIASCQLSTNAVYRLLYALLLLYLIDRWTKICKNISYILIWDDSVVLYLCKIEAGKLFLFYLWLVSAISTWLQARAVQKNSVLKILRLCKYSYWPRICCCVWWNCMTVFWYPWKKINMFLTHNIICGEKLPLQC